VRNKQQIIWACVAAVTTYTEKSGRTWTA